MFNKYFYKLNYENSKNIFNHKQNSKSSESIKNYKTANLLTKNEFFHSDCL